MIKLVNLPIPVSTNQLYKNRIGGRCKTDKYKEYEIEFSNWALFFRKQVKEAMDTLIKDDYCELSLKLTYYIPRSRLYTRAGSIKRYDLSNRVKAIEDKLFAVLGWDDSCVFKLVLEKVVSDRDCVDVEISKHIKE